MSTSLTLTQIAVNHLNQTRKWTHFLSIVGFVMCAIIAIIALFLSSIITRLFSSMAFADEFVGTMGSGFFTVSYLVVALICFFLYLYLYRFSKRLKTALATNNSEVLEEAFHNLKAHYKLTGILTLVTLGLYALALLAGIIGAIAGM